MIDRNRYALALALLLAPLAAHGQSSPHAAPQPANAAEVAPAIGSAREGGGDAGSLAAEEDLFASGLGDGIYLAGGDLDGGGADDASGLLEGDGAQRPGGRGMGPGPGMGMGDSPGMHMGKWMGMRQGMGARHAGLGRWNLARGGMPEVMRFKLAQLDLSDAQRDKLRDLHDAHARRAIQRRADIQLARMDLQRLMRAEKPDAGAVNSQIDKLAKLHSDGLKSKFEMQMQSRAVLTPEQVEKLHAPLDPALMRHDMMDAPDGRPKR